MNRPTETPMRKLLLAGAAIAGLMAASATAEANIFPFSGSGPSGFLAPGSEPWSYGGASPPGTTDVGWGSPGVGAGTTVFTGSIPVSVRVPVERDHGFRWKMITQSGGT